MSYSGKKANDDDEVEQLLRAAHDDVLLKLNVNSHMARASASAAIDPDLNRRFQALKKPQEPTKAPESKKSIPAKVDTGGSKADGADTEDDLFARFAALKNSLPSSNQNENKSNFPDDVSVNHQVVEEESEDEVEKVIKWAIDAATLDPSPPSDDDECSCDDDDLKDDDGVHDGKKGKRN